MHSESSRDPAEEFVERECLLFEAGEYPDRGITVTEDDLRAIAENTPDEIPVRIEHLSETAFDGALGVVTRIRAVGRQLWGTLRQPAEAWRFVQRAGARLLSVALDVTGRRLVETSFVHRPRVAGAQVFSLDRAWFCSRVFEIPESIGGHVHEEEDEVTSVRQFAEGLIQHLRGVVGGGDDSGEARFAQERTALEFERAALRAEAVDHQIAEMKRRGLIRGTERAELLARAILQNGVTHVVLFGESETNLSVLFAQFLEENGGVVPMGEMARSDVTGNGMAADRLISLAREMARREEIPYVTAFSRVSGEHPDLARAARDESGRA